MWIYLLDDVDIRLMKGVERGSHGNVVGVIGVLMIMEA